MISNNNGKDHSGVVLVGALMFMAILGPAIFSGLIISVLLLCAWSVIKVSRSGWLYGLMALAMWCFWLYIFYYFSSFYELPMDVLRWETRLIWLIALFFDMDREAGYWNRTINYMYYSLNFAPLGFLFWIGLTIHKKWYRGLFKWVHRQQIERLNMTKRRENSRDAFLGVDKNSGASILMSEDMRLRHTQVLGATGCGKTESVLKGLIHNDIQCGRGFLLIDGKGDASLRDQIFMAAETHNRLNDICYFDYSDPVRGMTYNPLLSGSATEVRDRIIDALDWSEEYYKKCASSALLITLQIFEHRRQKPTLEKIVSFLMNPNAFPGEIPEELKSLYKDFRENHAKRLPEIKGLVTDLNNLILSGSGRSLNAENPDINLFQAIRDKRIVIFQVSTLDLGMTAKSFGRLVVQDLKSVCGMINRKPNFPRNLFSVYIDEFESFAHESFNELLSKARSAGIGITILHQSMGDLEKIGPFFQKQITENTNNKIILRVNDEETVEYFANMSGTKQTTRMTYQMEEDFFSARKTGMGSRREVEEFNVHPNIIRNLRIGEAVIMTRNTGRSHVTKLDRPPSYESSYDYVAMIRTRARKQTQISKSDEGISNREPSLSAEIF